MKILYHVGVHKTGTTLIQKFLRMNKRRLLRRGVLVAYDHFPDLAKYHRYAQRAHVNGRGSAKQKWDLVRKLNGDVEARAKELGAEVIIFSDENRIGSPVYTLMKGGHIPAGFYPDAYSLMENLTRGFSDDIKKEIVLYTREHKSLVLSLYSEAIRNLAVRMDLETFVRSIDLNSFRFSRLIADLRQLNGIDAIHQKKFEHIREGAEQYLSDFLSVVEVSSEGLVLPSEVERGSLGKDSIAALLDLMAKRETGMEEQEFRSERSRILDIASSSGKKMEMPVALGAELDRIEREEAMQAN